MSVIDEKAINASTINTAEVVYLLYQIAQWVTDNRRNTYTLPMGDYANDLEHMALCIFDGRENFDTTPINW